MRYRSRSMMALGALILTFGIAACGDDDGSADGADTTAGDGPSTVTVEVDDNFFDPETVDVSVGDTVNWEWVGVEPHNVVGDDFSSEIQQEGTYEYTFDETGTYQYTCTVHPGMDGVVEVS